MLKSILSMALEYRGVYKKIWWVIPSTIFVVLAALIEPYIYKLIVDSLAGSPRESIDMSFIAKLIGIWAGILIVSIFVEYLRDYYTHFFMHQEWASVVGRGMQGFLAKEYSFHLEMNNAEKIKIFNR